MLWRIQDAQQHLEQVIACALNDGPQTIARDGIKVADVVSVNQYRQLTGETPDLKEFLLNPNGPDLSVLDLERHKSLPRDIDYLFDDLFDDNEPS